MKRKKKGQGMRLAKALSLTANRHLLAFQKLCRKSGQMRTAASWDILFEESISEELILLERRLEKRVSFTSAPL